MLPFCIFDDSQTFDLCYEMTSLYSKECSFEVEQQKLLQKQLQQQQQQQQQFVQYHDEV